MEQTRDLMAPDPSVSSLGRCPPLAPSPEVCMKSFSALRWQPLEARPWRLGTSMDPDTQAPWSSHPARNPKPGVVDLACPLPLSSPAGQSPSPGPPPPESVFSVPPLHSMSLVHPPQNDSSSPAPLPPSHPPTRPQRRISNLHTLPCLSPAQNASSVPHCLKLKSKASPGRAGAA